jgi:hypothetical protein
MRSQTGWSWISPYMTSYRGKLPPPSLLFPPREFDPPMRKRARKYERARAILVYPREISWPANERSMAVDQCSDVQMNTKVFFSSFTRASEEWVNFIFSGNAATQLPKVVYGPNISPTTVSSTSEHKSIELPSNNFWCVQVQTGKLIFLSKSFNTVYS